MDGGNPATPNAAAQMAQPVDLEAAAAAADGVVWFSTPAATPTPAALADTAAVRGSTPPKLALEATGSTCISEAQSPLDTALLHLAGAALQYLEAELSQATLGAVSSTRSADTHDGSPHSSVVGSDAEQNDDGSLHAQPAELEGSTQRLSKESSAAVASAAPEPASPEPAAEGTPAVAAKLAAAAAGVASFPLFATPTATPAAAAAGSGSVLRLGVAALLGTPATPAGLHNTAAQLPISPLQPGQPAGGNPLPMLLQRWLPLENPELPADTLLPFEGAEQIGLLQDPSAAATVAGTAAAWSPCSADARVAAAAPLAGNDSWSSPSASGSTDRHEEQLDGQQQQQQQGFVRAQLQSGLPWLHSAAELGQAGHSMQHRSEAPAVAHIGEDDGGLPAAALASLFDSVAAEANLQAQDDPAAAAAVGKEEAEAAVLLPAEDEAALGQSDTSVQLQQQQSSQNISSNSCAMEGPSSLALWVQAPTAPAAEAALHHQGTGGHRSAAAVAAVAAGDYISELARQLLCLATAEMEQQSVNLTRKPSPVAAAASAAAGSKVEQQQQHTTLSGLTSPTGPGSQGVAGADPQELFGSTFQDFDRAAAGSVSAAGSSSGSPVMHHMLLSELQERLGGLARGNSGEVEAEQLQPAGAAVSVDQAAAGIASAVHMKVQQAAAAETAAVAAALYEGEDGESEEQLLPASRSWLAAEQLLAMVCHSQEHSPVDGYSSREQTPWENAAAASSPPAAATTGQAAWQQPRSPEPPVLAASAGQVPAEAVATSEAGLGAAALAAAPAREHWQGPDMPAMLPDELSCELSEQGEQWLISSQLGLELSSQLEGHLSSAQQQVEAVSIDRNSWQQPDHQPLLARKPQHSSSDVELVPLTEDETQQQQQRQQSTRDRSQQLLQPALVQIQQVLMQLRELQHLGSPESSFNELQGLAAAAEVGCRGESMGVPHPADHQGVQQGGHAGSDDLQQLQLWEHPAGGEAAAQAAAAASQPAAISAAAAVSEAGTPTRLLELTDRQRSTADDEWLRLLARVGTVDDPIQLLRALRGPRDDSSRDGSSRSDGSSEHDAAPMGDSATPNVVDVAAPHATGIAVQTASDMDSLAAICSTNEVDDVDAPAAAAAVAGAASCARAAGEPGNRTAEPEAHWQLPNACSSQSSRSSGSVEADSPPPHPQQQSGSGAAAELQCTEQSARAIVPAQDSPTRASSQLRSELRFECMLEAAEICSTSHPGSALSATSEAAAAAAADTVASVDAAAVQPMGAVEEAPEQQAAAVGGMPPGITLCQSEDVHASSRGVSDAAALTAAFIDAHRQSWRLVMQELLARVQHQQQQHEQEQHDEQLQAQVWQLQGLAGWRT